MAYLGLQNGERYEATRFGAETNTEGEVVFSTGMVGYPQSLTDPSYAGQILVLSYPLIGNYGVADKSTWESERIWVKGLVVASYINTPSHYTSILTLHEWLVEQGVPGLMVSDTRKLVQSLREQGVMQGTISTSSKTIIPKHQKTVNWVDLVSHARVHIWEPVQKNAQTKTIVLIDCGAKRNIIHSLMLRNMRVVQVPWNYDLSTLEQSYDGVVVSNGPGDPKQAGATIATVTGLLERKVPILGICLGNQILSLAAGGDTYKLKYGHRGHNQPCLQVGSERCYLTTQNHGYAVNDIPPGFKPWFVNVNDATNEGIIHNKLPVMSVQFHPESTPGPTDTDWIFDYFIERLCA